MENNNIIILSFYESQYLFFYQKYIFNKKNIKYYFFKSKNKNRIKSFIYNFKIARKNSKFIKFLNYYFLKFLFSNRFSRKYSKIKQNLFYENFEQKVNYSANIKIISSLDEIKTDESDVLITFGFDFIKKDFYSKFKYRLNIHLGDLPKYSGLKSFERMLIDDADFYVSVNEIDSIVDNGKILYKDKLSTIDLEKPFNNYINMFYLAFDIICDISKNKINYIEAINDKDHKTDSKINNTFFGFEFNEIYTKSFLRKINW